MFMIDLGGLFYWDGETYNITAMVHTTHLLHMYTAQKQTGSCLHITRLNLTIEVRHPLRSTRISTHQHHKNKGDFNTGNHSQH